MGDIFKSLRAHDNMHFGVYVYDIKELLENQECIINCKLRSSNKVIIVGENYTLDKIEWRLVNQRSLATHKYGSKDHQIEVTFCFFMKKTAQNVIEVADSFESVELLRYYLAERNWEVSRHEAVGLRNIFDYLLK